MKGKKVHGVHNIDSYSIKIGGPLMEEALLQLVNKSIEQRKFAKNWKHISEGITNFQISLEGKRPLALCSN